MKSLNKNSFGKKYNKYSISLLIMAGLLFTDTILSQELPTWEVNNPISKVFVMDEIPPTAGSLAAGNETVPNAYLVDPAIDTLLLLMETQDIFLHKTSAQPSGIIGSNGIVVIKASFQWDFRNTTSTDRIKGLIWQILQHPDGFTGEILVGDNTQWASIGEDDNNSEDTEQCILDVINTFYSKGYPVYLFRWADIMYNVVTEYSDGNYNDGYTYEPISKITYPKFQSPAGNYISLKYGIWNETTQTYDHNRLCIVDFPVLKAHGWTGATLAVKNWMGVLTVAHQNERYGGDVAMHFDYMFSEYALIAKVMQVTFPKLTIIDAAWTNPERNYGNIATQLNMLLGSTDPFAASWYAAKYMLTPVAYYPERTNPDNPGGVYNEFLNNQYNCMHDSGFAVTKDSSEISVYNRAELHTITTNIKAFLEGPYNGSGAMTTTLNTNDLIPLNSNDAYSTVTYGYTASTVDSIPNSDIVDWVLVELRTGTDSLTKVAKRAAFLKNDGTLVDLDGVSNIKFPTVAEGDYYVVIIHRNHLAVMTSTPVTVSFNPTLYDMSTDLSKVYGKDAMKSLGSGYYGMFAADTDGSGTVNASDRNNTWNERNQSGYLGTDVDLSGTVNAADRNTVWNNRNISEQVP